MVLGIVLDEWIGVYLPKTVFIQNARLGFVDIFLKLCVVAYVVVSYFQNAEVVGVSFQPESAITVWADPADHGKFDSVSEADWASSMCDPSRNDRYDYLYDKDGNWSYTNVTCIELAPRERMIKTPASMYAPTYMEETFSRKKLADKNKGGSCNNARCSKLGSCPGDSTKNYTSGRRNRFGHCMCECIETQRMLVTGVPALRVHFNHLPRWPLGDLDKLKDHGITQPESLKDIDMITIIRKQGKGEYKRFQPGEDITLTIEEFLMLGGDVSLDGHSNDFTRRNALLDKVGLPADYRSQLTAYPHTRIVGMKIHVYVSYYNERAPQHEHEALKPKPICYIDVKCVAAWEGDPTNAVLEANVEGEDTVRTRYYQGVRVSFVVSGNYAFFETLKFFTYLASAIVYLQVPNIFMTYFTRYCLGTLSDMYYKSQCQLLDSWELFSGQVCRALVGMFAFKKLLDGQSKTLLKQNGSKERVNYLQWGALRAHLQQLFEEQKELDAHEIDGLLRVLLKILDTHKENAIHQQQFVDATVNSDIGTLKNWARLFDQDRKPWFLERLFDTQARERARHAEIVDDLTTRPDACLRVASLRSEDEPFDITVTEPAVGALNGVSVDKSCQASTAGLDKYCQSEAKFVVL